jgi:hypothetical protein
MRQQNAYLSACTLDRSGSAALDQDAAARDVDHSRRGKRARPQREGRPTLYGVTVADHRQHRD